MQRCTEKYVNRWSVKDGGEILCCHDVVMTTVGTCILKIKHVQIAWRRLLR